MSAPNLSQRKALDIYHAVIQYAKRVTGGNTDPFPVRDAKLSFRLLVRQQLGRSRFRDA
jgi:hypothetical protein